MGIALEENAQWSTIRLEGAIDIGCAAELKQALLRAFASGRQVRVALDGATELDVTAMQLLWAAGQESRVSAAMFTMVGEMPEPISIALADAGFEGFSIAVQEARIQEA